MSALLWAGFDDPVVIATFVAGIVSAIAVLIATALSNKFLNKQQQIHGLLEAFKLLNDNAHRDARKTVYVLFFKNLKDTKLDLFADVPQVGQVMADFDVIGRLVRSGNIRKDDFLNVYGSLVYRCWRILEKHINEERKSRHFDQFMDNFAWLSKEGLKYWEKKQRDVKESVLYNPLDHTDNVDFQKEFW